MRTSFTGPERKRILLGNEAEQKSVFLHIVYTHVHSCTVGTHITWLLEFIFAIDSICSYMYKRVQFCVEKPKHVYRHTITANTYSSVSTYNTWMHEMSVCAIAAAYK